ncbi:MAG: hypothetical protein VKP62_16890 [Candidatus Sericytochromatia bacterium]|nr:hypothetical protein [Candidatus Sericytochromatia bacterium]
MATAVVFSVALLVASGCARAGNPGPVVSVPGSLGVRSEAGLAEGFNKVYAAAFAKADANADLMIDEFEAGPFIDVRDYQRADDDRNGKLSEREFRTWASRGGVFGLFHQNVGDFVRIYRRSLLKAFEHLDTDKNALLSPSESNDAALQRANLTLTLKGIRTAVRITAIDAATFQAADKTQDGQLSQAEFEDLAIAAWVTLINPPKGDQSTTPLR